MSQWKDGEDFDAYDLTLEVVVSSDGKVKGIQNIKWSDKSMQSWYKDAEKKIVPQLIANGLDTSKNYDVVTGATCSSNGIDQCIQERNFKDKPIGRGTKKRYETIKTI